MMSPNALRDLVAIHRQLMLAETELALHENRNDANVVPEVARRNC